MGLLGKPGTSSLNTATYGKTRIYQVKYELDQYGRRKNPIPNKNAKKFAIFFGGSNTFGKGLPVETTLPYLFEKKNSQFRSYNYAFPGWGPNSHLRQLQVSSIPDQVSQKEGLVIYQYFDFHLERVLGTASYFSWSHGKSPYYQLVDGQLKYRGLFYKARPFYVLSLKILYAGFLSFFHKNIPSVNSDYSMDLNCTVIRQMKTLVENQFPKVKFIVLVGLMSASEDPFIDRCFVKNAMTVIDARLDNNGKWKASSFFYGHIPDPLDFNGNKVTFDNIFLLKEVEKHYNGTANEVLVNRLNYW